MLKYLIKNFGLTLCGLCILASAATVCDALDGVKEGMKTNTAQVRQMNACAAGLAGKIPMSALASIK